MKPKTPKDIMIENLKKMLDEACDAYYNTPFKTMTDEEFDNACINYKKLTGKDYNTQTPPREGKRTINISHTFENLLGTIDNKFQNLDDFVKWLESLYEDLNLTKDQPLQLMVSEKYDGNSCAIEYENGKCKLAVTRGEDGKGADLTDVFKDETLKVKTDKYIGIRYEVMLTYDNFNKLNLVKQQLKDNIYVNPRSTVSGLLGRNDAVKFKDYLTLVPLALRIKGEDLPRLDELDLLNEYQKITDIDFNAELFEGDFNELVEAITEMYNRYIPLREKMKYMIDGLVIEVINTEYRKTLGYFSTGSPKFSAALKFPYMEKSTYVEDIVFEPSPNGSGKITPSVIYQPVVFNGATMRKTSLANYKRFKELNLGKGSKIMVEYHNDVLCYVNPLDTPENKKIKPIPFTNFCPVCNAPVYINDKKTFAYCSNPNCESKVIGKINAYTTQVGMKGIEYSTIKKLYDNGLIKQPSDLYRLRENQISSIEGLGDISAKNIINIIKNNRPKDYELLSGLGITNLGKEIAKTILNEVSFDQLSDINYVRSNEFKSRISSLDGIGPIMTKRISEELEKNNTLLYDLLSNVKFQSTKREKLDQQLIFVQTGDSDPEYFKSRSELKEYIETKGHKMTNSISKKTDYLITENPNSGTVKNRKAKELGIKIITCAELRELLG